MLAEMGDHGGGDVMLPLVDDAVSVAAVAGLTEGSAEAQVRWPF
jgi:hypothetical protein